MSQIVWLASYPKSGNTWLRAFLANYQRADGKPAGINALGVGPIASKRALFDETTGIESSDLSPDEIDHYRPAVYRQLASETTEMLLLKIHDAYTFTDRGEPLVPADVSRGAIYILRNPLDVAVSFSYHAGISMDQTIQRMADETFAFADSARRLPRHLRTLLLSWSRHVLSWVEQTHLPLHLMRYEDMLACPTQAFSAAVRFIGWEEDPTRIARAVQFTAFENLWAQERERGFQEKPPGMESFFRRGKAGSWRTELNAEQVARIIRDHGAVMRRFGYLSENGEILDSTIKPRDNILAQNLGQDVIHLSNEMSATTAERQASPAQALCKACGLCCDGTLFSSVTLAPTDGVVPLEMAGVAIIADNEQRAFKQPCAAYQNRICTIYTERPHACRKYRCKLLKQYSRGEVSREQALEIIHKTVRHKENVRTQMLTVSGANDQSLGELYQALKKSRSELGSASSAKRYGSLFLNYIALQVRLDRYFREKKPVEAA